MTTQHVVKLSKPLPTHKGNVSELTLGAITADIMIRNKRLPFSIKEHADGSREVETDFQLATKYLADLTGHDEAVLGSLPLKDFMSAVTELGKALADSGN